MNEYINKKTMRMLMKDMRKYVDKELLNYDEKYDEQWKIDIIVACFIEWLEPEIQYRTKQRKGYK